MKKLLLGLLFTLMGASKVYAGYSLCADNLIKFSRVKPKVAVEACDKGVESLCVINMTDVGAASTSAIEACASGVESICVVNYVLAGASAKDAIEACSL